ncbi:MAG: BatD family protein, partial [Gemmatimonadota bacterium]
RKQLHEDETLQLRVVGDVKLNLSFNNLWNLNSLQLPKPDLGNLTQDFDIVNRRQSYNIKSINGNTTARVTWTYVLAPRRTGQLPLGWKQRLALGCAVLHEPAVLFLDEPTSGVDPAARRTFWDLIYEMAESGTTILVSTHYMEEAEYCGRVALMNRGRLIALDRPASLRSSLAEPILEVRTDEAARAVEALAGADAVIEAAMFGRRLHVAAEDENRARAAITRRLDAAGLSLESIERIQPSLEDVFVSMVRREGGTVAE